jgi:asparagine synthetase B (glutamine-hydrolysing)
LLTKYLPMCGILLVQSRDSIPVEKHLQAFVKLQSRGPDFARYQYRNNIFIGQAVLHITGSDQYYQHEHPNFLAYNGEIYNYQEFGPFENDIEFIHHAVENDPGLLTLGWGPWAWAWSNGHTVLYATDPQGERCLYQYQDDSILIVCSEVAPILEYVGRNSVRLPYQNKLWTMLDQTVWKDIKKIEPGQLYQNGEAVQTIDSVWSWIRPVKYRNINEAYEDFQSQWQTATQLMTPSCPAALTYSGGLDSSIIMSHIDNLELYSVNCVGKDPIVDRIREFLTAEEQSRLHEFNVNEQQWANEFQQLMARTCMPAQSWSHVGQWIVNRNCKQRVLFTGCGADELFGGYNVYRDLTYDVAGSASPYSKHGDPAIWQRCLDVYNGDPQQATLLMDYWHQVVGCDARGVDVISGAWGIESRNPFLARPIMQLALNLPFEFKVGTVPKPMIRQMFLERWHHDMILPKKGFTGHANDSLPYLPVTIESTGDRLLDWKQIVQQSFYDSNS